MCLTDHLVSYVLSSSPSFRDVDCIFGGMTQDGDLMYAENTRSSGQPLFVRIAGEEDPFSAIKVM